jgi:hypothetical protein
LCEVHEPLRETASAPQFSSLIGFSLKTIQFLEPIGKLLFYAQFEFAESTIWKSPVPTGINAE